MNIAEDYFLLYHGKKHYPKHCFLKLKDKKDDELLEFVSIVVSINRKNVNRFTSISILQELLKRYFDSYIPSIDDIYEYQYNLLDIYLPTLHTKELELLLRYFTELKNANIISYEEHSKLANIFDTLKQRYTLQADTKAQDNYKQKDSGTFLDIHKKHIIDTIKRYEEITNEPLDNLRSFIYKQTFSIGITGIINSGKSTLLNALLSREILGTSVIPETANLTILKQTEDATNEKALVSFWKKKEWEQIEKDSKKIASIERFVKEAKKHFKDRLHDYITQEGKTIEVNLDDISAYTSANHPSRYSNLVKSITLYTKTNFLKNGIEIVDTPGLDDPVLQREEITKSYLAGCDTLMHLMNVNQAATMVDVEFITDTVLYHNISKLIIVLTKADTIDDKELNEVLRYTKESIKKNLQEKNKLSEFDFLISKLEFIPVSSQMALICKNDPKKAKQLGYSFEKSGIPKVQRSIKEILFAKENQKNQILLNTAKIRLKDTISSKIEMIKFDMEMLSKDKEEIENLIKRQKSEQIEQKRVISKIKDRLKMERLYIKEQFAIEKNGIKDRLMMLGDLLSERILEDIEYELKKHKTTPKNDRLVYMFKNGKKDGLIDILSDYNYRIYKHFASSKETISDSFTQISINLDQEYINKIDATLIDKIVLSSTTSVVQSIIKTVKKIKPNNYDRYKKDIQFAIKEHFMQLTPLLVELLDEINDKKLKNFNDETVNSIERLEQKVSQKESILRKRVKNTLLSEKERSEQTNRLYKQLNALKELLDNLEKVSI